MPSSGLPWSSSSLESEFSLLIQVDLKRGEHSGRNPIKSEVSGQWNSVCMEDNFPVKVRHVIDIRFSVDVTVSYCSIVNLAFHRHDKKIAQHFPAAWDLWCHNWGGHAPFSTGRSDLLMAGHPSFAEFLTKIHRPEGRWNPAALRYTRIPSEWDLQEQKTASLQNISCVFILGLQIGVSSRFQRQRTLSVILKNWARGLRSIVHILLQLCHADQRYLAVSSWNTRNAHEERCCWWSTSSYPIW